MNVPENRRGMKHAPGETIVEGDWIYRPGPDGDYLMIVETVGKGTFEGMEAFSFSGNVYVLAGEGAGPQPAFLGGMQAHLAGTSEWYLPIGKKITKGCALDESDWQVP